MSMFIDEVLLFSTGKKNPMKKKKFHELSLYQKVWVLKSLCDHCLVSEVFLFVSEIYIVRIMNVKEKKSKLSILGFKTNVKNCEI